MAPSDELPEQHREEASEFAKRRRAALAMGGEPKLVQRREIGVLNARERVAALFDPDTWEEVGLFAASEHVTERERTPTDGKITGFGRIEGRHAAVVAYDFTVKGSSSGTIGERKIGYIKEKARAAGVPLLFLAESTGARMPDIMGAEGMASLDGRTRFLRTRETPWVTAVMGNAFGSAAWHACAADFCVIRKGSVMAVSSPLLVRYATREEVDPDSLGGWRLHSETTGLADAVADTDEEAIQVVKRFVGYLPSHHSQPPPVLPENREHQDRSDELLRILPELRRRAYDVRKVISVIADENSVFEIKPRFGKNVTAALVRLGGRAVGVLASNPHFQGGAIDSDACDKAVDFLVLCDSYNIPLVFLVDQPGFLVGLEAERRRIAGKVINWMNALSLVTVPRIMVLLRKSYGQAFINMGGAGTSDASAAWWSAEISFMDPEAAAAIVGSREPGGAADDRVRVDMARDTSAYALASVFGVQSVIDPRETRSYLIRQLQIHAGPTRAVGKHLLASWPTSY